MTAARFRIRRVPFVAAEYDRIAHPYGLRDSRERVYVDKYGRPDPDYWCVSRAVAVMRRRDLNEYDRGRRP